MDNNELYHYGRKGMKWYQNIFSSRSERIRRKQQQANLEKARQARTAKKELEAKKERILKSGKPKDILKNKNLFSNEELQKAIDRFDLEKKISEADSRQTSRGQKLVMDILEGSTKNIGQQTVTYFMGKGVNKIFAEIANDPSIINPKKGQKDK